MSDRTNNTITFTTDFGLKSSYVAQMKAVALSMTNASLIDISHSINPQNITEGAFVLMTSVPFFPSGSVHVAVIDPGVGSDRRGLVIATPSQILVGPDNGLLIPTAKKLGNFMVYEIENKDLFRSKVSNTFHGRDIFTPVAAHIINGLHFAEIGPIVNDYVDFDFNQYKINSKTAVGRIIYIDDFGNIITSIDGINLRSVLDFDTTVMLFIGEKQVKLPFIRTYSNVKPKSMLATIGSSNFLEISINKGNAASKLKVKYGDKVKILFG